MPRNPSIRCPLAAVLLLFVTALPGQLARAERLDVYDLDSLVYLSTDVVEAEIISRQENRTLAIIDVKILRVHKGNLSKGQMVAVAHTDSYRKPKPNDYNHQPLAAGDRLALFMVRAKANGFNQIPKDREIYAPLPGGVRLIDSTHVLSNSQDGDRGGFVVALPGNAKANLTVERFRETVRASVENTTQWARLLEATQAELDVPRLMKLLADRSRQRDYHRDYITEQICIRFANSHDLIVLTEALPLANDHYCRSILHYGFGTPEGRRCLLTKVNDANESLPARLRYAFALRNAGTVYRSTFSEIHPNGHREEGQADEGNSDYIIRIAEAARANAKHEELCGSLVWCIDYFGQGIVQNKPEPLMHDLRGALAVLKELYDAKPSEELQFAIEKATAWDRESYENLQSPSGSLISILRRVDATRYTKPEKRSLIFAHEYSTTLLPKETELQPSVMLIHLETQKAHVLPMKLRIRGWSTGGGSNSIELPSDLPPGRYRVFFQIKEGDCVISTGHYFTADL